MKRTCEWVISHDSFTCDKTHSRATWLIHMRRWCEHEDVCMRHNTCITWMSHVAWICGASSEWVICMWICVMLRVNEACHRYQKNEACRMCECVVLQVNESCEYECVFCHMWMRHVTCIKRMSHVACIYGAPSECVMRMNVFCHVWMSHGRCLEWMSHVACMNVWYTKCMSPVVYVNMSFNTTHLHVRHGSFSCSNTHLHMQHYSCTCNTTH